MCQSHCTDMELDLEGSRGRRPERILKVEIGWSR